MAGEVNQGALNVKSASGGVHVQPKYLSGRSWTIDAVRGGPGNAALAAMWGIVIRSIQQLVLGISRLCPASRKQQQNARYQPPSGKVRLPLERRC